MQSTQDKAMTKKEREKIITEYIRNNLTKVELRKFIELIELLNITDEQGGAV